MWDLAYSDQQQGVDQPVIRYQARFFLDTLPGYVGRAKTLEKRNLSRFIYASAGRRSEIL
jgi:hypothetical protein